MPCACSALADVVEDQFAQLFKDMGIDTVDFLPPRRSDQAVTRVTPLKS